MQSPLPISSKERTEALWRLFWDIANRAEVVWTDPRGAAGERARPRRQTLRALAALFPGDLAGAIGESDLENLKMAMAGPDYKESPSRDTRHACRRQFLNSRWIRQRLDAVMGEGREFRDHARRLLVSAQLSDGVSRKGFAYVVRAGRKGEYETAALRENLAILGFGEVGDLSSCDSPPAVSERVRRAYPAAKAGQVNQWAGSLKRFVLDLRVGDWVLMPRKVDRDTRNTIAVGRVTGPYAFREVDGTSRHTRTVVWEQREVSRGRFDGRFADALQSAHTVTWVDEEDAAAKLTSLLEERPDPEPHLDPRPAVERQKSIPSPFDDVLNLLAFVKDRCPYEDVLHQIRAGGAGPEGELRRGTVLPGGNTSGRDAEGG